MAAVVPEQLATHRTAVRSLLVRMVKDESLADDLVQEALLRATRAAKTWRGDASPKTWLTAIALNLARDHFRTAARVPQLTSLDQAAEVPAAERPEEGLLQAEMSSCILEYITNLPERQRDAVLLHHFSGLGHREIAAALEISEGNARVILHRGLATLHDSLARGCALDFDSDIPCERR